MKRADKRRSKTSVRERRPGEAPSKEWVGEDDVAKMLRDALEDMTKRYVLDARTVETREFLAELWLHEAMRSALSPLFRTGMIDRDAQGLLRLSIDALGSAWNLMNEEHRGGRPLGAPMDS